MKTLFNNTEVAFALKNNSQLKRAYYLFKMIEKPALVKIGTALTHFALKLHLPVEGIIRGTVFNHFCGGVSVADSLEVVDLMHTKNVSSVLDYSVEGKQVESQFDATLEMTLKTIACAKERISIPFAVFKPTGLGRFELYQKIGENIAFTTAETEEWNRVVTRFDTICKMAHDNDVAVLIDGEETWMQDAADAVVLQMMQKYNKKKAIVFNTLQLYRWDRLDYLKKVHEIANKEHFFIGMKLVRGAYMEKENERALEKGYKSPICETKAATDANFDATVTYMLENIAIMSVYEGTHNENSTYLLMDLMEKNGIAKNDTRVWFGQLYGMSDNISFNLAENGYNVSKYLPFGPVRDVMPYLIRRAQENTSVAGQTSRELDLIKREMGRRKL